MLMPGRAGALTASGLWQQSGSGNALQANPSYDSRTGNEPLEYRATQSITFLPGFESGEGDAFEAYITTDNGGSGSGGTGTGGVFASGGYRYGFNGKENDDEVKGEGNQQDYGKRIYDPRLGRFLSTDPLAKSFPWYSPFQFAGNMPIAAIDLDGEEQKIMINWHDVNGNISRTKIIKSDFDNVNKLWQSLSQGLNKETTYTLEGTKFNANNAQFTSGFEPYKKGQGARTTFIRPNNGTLTFDIAADAKGNQSVKINFNNAPVNEKELFADALRGAAKVTNVAGTAIEGIGYVASAVPGGQALGLGLIGIGKTTGAVGDVMDIGADILERKDKDAAIKTTFALISTVAGDVISATPLKPLGKQAIDTYVGKGVGAVKDGYFKYNPPKVEESDHLDLKIEKSKKE
jgi:RHS repeat-associated protein